MIIIRYYFYCYALFFYCFIIYMLYEWRECFAKGHLSEDDLREQLNTLEVPVKLK